LRWTAFGSGGSPWASQDNLWTLGTRNFFFLFAFMACGDVLGGIDLWKIYLLFEKERSGTGRIELWISASSMPDDDDGPWEKINGMSEDWV